MSTAWHSVVVRHPTMRHQPMVYVCMRCCCLAGRPAGAGHWWMRVSVCVCVPRNIAMHTRSPSPISPSRPVKPHNSASQQKHFCTCMVHVYSGAYRNWMLFLFLVEQYNKTNDEYINVTWIHIRCVVPIFSLVDANLAQIGMLASIRNLFAQFFEWFHSKEFRWKDRAGWLKGDDPLKRLLINKLYVNFSLVLDIGTASKKVKRTNLIWAMNCRYHVKSGNRYRNDQLEDFINSLR